MGGCWGCRCLPTCTHRSQGALVGEASQDAKVLVAAASHRPAYRSRRAGKVMPPLARRLHPSLPHRTTTHLAPGQGPSSPEEVGILARLVRHHQAAVCQRHSVRHHIVHAKPLALGQLAPAAAQGVPRDACQGQRQTPPGCWLPLIITTTVITHTITQSHARAFRGSPTSAQSPCSAAMPCGSSAAVRSLKRTPASSTASPRSGSTLICGQRGPASKGAGKLHQQREPVRVPC